MKNLMLVVLLSCNAGKGGNLPWWFVSVAVADKIDAVNRVAQPILAILCAGAFGYQIGREMNNGTRDLTDELREIGSRGLNVEDLTDKQKKEIIRRSGLSSAERRLEDRARTREDSKREA